MKKALFFTLITCAICALFCFGVSAETYEGKCGENITFKYFDKIQNDNSAFWDKNRKNWLHILSDDYQENYNRTPVYPEISDEMNEVLKGVQNKLKENRRGIIE